MSSLMSQGGGLPMQMPANMNININQMGSKVSNQISKTAESLFSNQLASALDTISDSQFFQDSISPSTIRTQFLSVSSDPSNPSATPVLMNSMKWLLASMSKGRDVSDFFPHVVKLVSCSSLELRKMVYTYLTHYADHNSTCRDLALLSINAFQRDLSDSNPYIRPLALRVLTSIRVMDVLQIQILAVQSSLRDESPHVRKCAANALAKLYPRSDEENQLRLKEILKMILMEDTCCIVLTSAMVSFVEMCPNDLHLLHGCYRKMCHLLTDMDEWGQIVVLDVLSRYCRTFFQKPHSNVNDVGSAEAIDRQRRVVRKVVVDHNGTVNVGVGYDQGVEYDDEAFGTLESQTEATPTSSASKRLSKKKRRVVRKGFYSDEEDESSEEEIDIPMSRLPRSRGPGQSLASVMRSPARPIHDTGDVMFSGFDHGNPNGIGGVAEATCAVDEDGTLDEDHRLLLRSSLPLLKSRNSGVVLGVCSLHYYCGVTSIKIRSSMGKALVRIYHDRREIQFVVLNSIRMLVWECPSAFTPFLNDFFVKAMDPSFTRFVKLDILCALCLEPKSIDAVLKELRTYIRHDDKAFVCASVRAVGKIVEMARIIYDREGGKTGSNIEARNEANTIALNCLHGLLTLTEASDYVDVVGECVGVMQRIILLLQSDASNHAIKDPYQVQGMAMTRLLLLVVRSLSSIGAEDANDEGADLNDAVLNSVAMLPSDKIAPALWIIGEWLSSSSSKSSLGLFKADKVEKKNIQSELLRLMANAFPDLDEKSKCQCIHLVSKVILANASQDDVTLCEYILSLGRVDMNHDVRDRSRYESRILYMVKGIHFDTESLSSVPQNGRKITVEDAKTMLLKQKPAPSWLPIEGDKNEKPNAFRFGTLSSMVSHTAGNSYIPLPVWAAEDSPKSLRDPPQKEPKTSSSSKKKLDWNVDNAKTSAGFYDSDDDSSSSSLESSSSSTSSSDSSDDSSSQSSSSSSDDDSSDSSDDDTSTEEEESTSSEESMPMMGQISQSVPTANSQRRQIMPTQVTNNPLPLIDASTSAGESFNGENSSESDSDDSTSSSSSIISSEGHNSPSGGNSGLIDNTLINMVPDEIAPNKKTAETSASHGLEGLVMAPLVVDKNVIVSDGKIEDESSNWEVLVRHDLSGGLAVSIRFLRGSTRKKEARLIGFDPKNSAVVLAQLKFENRRTDGRSIRRIHLMKKKTTNSGAVPTTRILIPQEISSLESSKVSHAIVGLEFAQASDKDGPMHAKFDIKCDRGTTTVNICPSLAETLQQLDMTNEQFDSMANNMHGIHQRSSAKFTLSPDGIKRRLKRLPSKIQKASAMNLVTKWEDGHCKFVACLPASGNQVLLDIYCDVNSGSGEIVICCDSAMSLNTLLEFFKRVTME